MQKLNSTYHCKVMIQYYKKMNEGGEIVQLLICDQSNQRSAFTIDCWCSNDDLVEVDKMQEITMEEYKGHHVRLKLGTRSNNDIVPYGNGDERGIFRIEDFE